MSGRQVLTGTTDCCCEGGGGVGACCKLSFIGPCEEIPEFQCDEIGGVFYGEGTTCDDPDVCMGACCDGIATEDCTCTITQNPAMSGDCIAWRGPGTDCDEDFPCCWADAECCEPVVSGCCGLAIQGFINPSNFYLTITSHTTMDVDCSGADPSYTGNNDYTSTNKFVDVPDVGCVFQCQEASGTSTRDNVDEPDCNETYDCSGWSGGFGLDCFFGDGGCTCNPAVGFTNLTDSTRSLECECDPPLFGCAPSQLTIFQTLSDLCTE